MKDTNIVSSKLYPIVSEKLSNKNTKKKFIDNIAKFMNTRHEEVHAVAPYTRIVYNQKDVDDLFKAIDLNEKEVLKVLKDSIFFGESGYNPQCAREPYMEVLMCAIKYFMLNNETKTAELITIYTCFTGKIYASLHSLIWKYPPKREIMDYVVNNMLTDKYDLKKEGTVFKAMSKLSSTWMTTYEKKIKDSSKDDMIGKLIQQLRDRVRSFLYNIATLYYEAAANKNYMNYETDSLDEDDFRLTNNDATTAARITAGTVSLLMSEKPDLKLCEQCLYGITTIKQKYFNTLIERLVGDKNIIPELRRVINIIICDFMANPENRGKRVGGTEFIKYALKPTPNTKSKILIEKKAIITSWLNRYSDRYKDLTREATKNDYYKALLSYLVYSICKIANK